MPASKNLIFDINIHRCITDRQCIYINVNVAKLGTDTAGNVLSGESEGGRERDMG